MARSRSNQGKRGARSPSNQGQPSHLAGIQVNGWFLFAHPCFLDQLERLLSAVELRRQNDPTGYRESDDFKLLRQIGYLAFQAIPQDPTHKRYRQGKSLGKGRTAWFRAKFGGQRFRLFFRLQTNVQAIVYAWVNDEGSLRTYGSSTDAYIVFSDMLNRGNPPNDWDELLQQAQSGAARERAEAVTRRLGDVTGPE